MTQTPGALPWLEAIFGPPLTNRATGMAILGKPTPVERFVQLIPLRYPLAALAWTVVLGPVSFWILNLIQSGKIPPESLGDVTNSIAGGLLIFYLLYTVRYLRVKVVASESSISGIMPGGEAAYHSLFAGTTNLRPILYLFVVLETLTLLVTSNTLTLTIVQIFNRISQGLLILAFSTTIWEYSYAGWGLHRLGRSKIRLKSFLEDRFMGAKSVGNLALSLTVAYLGGLLLFFLDSATFLPVTTNPAFIVFFLTLLALGVLLFFLPLNSIHVKMQEEKVVRERDLSRQLLAIKHDEPGPTVESSASLETIQKAITDLVHLKDVEMTDRKLSSTPTWPFDVQVLTRLIIIVLSVTAALLARIITDFLKI